MTPCPRSGIKFDMDISDRDDNIITLLAYYLHLDALKKEGLLDNELLIKFYENLTDEQKMHLVFFQYKQISLANEWKKFLENPEPNISRSEAVRRTFDEAMKKFEERIKKTEK